MDERRKVSDYCARKELDEALSFARTIKDNWRRCQALSTVAEQVTDLTARHRILEASFKAAREQSEPNRIVSVSAWPLEVLAKEGNEPEVTRNLDWMLETIAREPHSVRRLDAILLVLAHICTGPNRPILRLADQCIIVAQNCPSWKKDRGMFYGSTQVAPVSIGKAFEMAELIFLPRMRRKALQHLELRKQIRANASHSST